MELYEISKTKKSFTTSISLNEKYTTVDIDKINDDSAEAEESATGTVQPGSDIKPKVTIQDVEGLAERLYGIVIKDIKEMESYDDRNYLIQEDKEMKNPILTNNWPHGYILKIINAHDSKNIRLYEAQNEILVYLRNQKIECPNPVTNLYGKYFSVENINGVEHIVRLLEFIPGKTFKQAPKTNYLYFSNGVYIAKLDRILKNFHHEVYETHQTLWMMQSIPKVKDYLYVIQDHERKQMIEDIIEAFEKKVLANIDSFEKQIIHGDFNEQNILVTKLRPKDETNSEYKVTGIIDFGDVSISPLFCELAVAMTYVILEANDLAAGGITLAGFTSVIPLGAADISMLKECIAARLCLSLVMGVYTIELHPNNDYVVCTQKNGWDLLESLWKDNFDKIDEIWQTTADNYLKQSCK